MNSISTIRCWRIIALLFTCASASYGQAEAKASIQRFAFGAAQPSPDWTPVGADDQFTRQLGHGFEPGTRSLTVNTSEPSRPTALSSDRPFYFSTMVPAEGNYLVKVTLGSPVAASSTVIKAELRRLMIEETKTASGEFKTVEFVVNVRTPKIAPVDAIAAGEVQLKAPRETIKEAWAWDDLITLEFNGAQPAVSAVEISPVKIPTVFLIGDSTVCDQSAEPYASWGQMLTAFFKPEVGVANHAESGETYRDSIGRRRLDKILTLMQPGDYLLMQFGHNDQKQIAAGKGGPFTTYKEEMKRHVDGVRARGGRPIIVSPMERHSFAENGKLKPTLTDYAEACRQAAEEWNVPLIDLNALSISLYEALGKAPAYLAFARTESNQDHTHHNNYGAYELAKCVARGLQTAALPLAKSLTDHVRNFDPDRPDPLDTFKIPASPAFTNQRPLGD